MFTLFGIIYIVIQGFLIVYMIDELIGNKCGDGICWMRLILLIIQVGLFVPGILFFARHTIFVDVFAVCMILSCGIPIYFTFASDCMGSHWGTGICGGISAVYFVLMMFFLQARQDDYVKDIWENNKYDIYECSKVTAEDNSAIIEYRDEKNVLHKHTISGTIPVYRNKKEVDITDNYKTIMIVEQDQSTDSCKMSTYIAILAKDRDGDPHCPVVIMTCSHIMGFLERNTELKFE